MKEYKFCQSCGMPFKEDPKKGGSEADGSKSTKYCSYCYVKGKFTSPKIKTAKEMQKFCMDLMQKNGKSKFVSWLFTRGIPRLERWKNR